VERHTESAVPGASVSNGIARQACKSGYACARLRVRVRSRRTVIKGVKPVGAAAARYASNEIASRQKHHVTAASRYHAR